MAKKHHDEGGGGEGWLVSYCDMISLLVTFFLMMMTFSTSHEGNVERLGVGILGGRGGVFDTRIPDGGVDPETLEILARELDRLRQSEGPEGRIALEPKLDGFSILFGEECSFAPGSAEVDPVLELALGEVARIVGRHGFQIVVEGYTDSGFKPTPRHPTPESLAAARAEEAAEVLLASGWIDPARLQLAAPGDARPRVPNETATMRTWNRRVELRVLPIRFEPESDEG